MRIAACLLHDVGKSASRIAFPKKAGSLTPEEFGLMKQPNRQRALDISAPGFAVKEMLRASSCNTNNGTGRGVSLWPAGAADYADGRELSGRGDTLDAMTTK